MRSSQADWLHYMTQVHRRRAQKQRTQGKRASLVCVCVLPCFFPPVLSHIPGTLQSPLSRQGSGKPTPGPAPPQVCRLQGASSRGEVAPSRPRFHLRKSTLEEAQSMFSSHSLEAQKVKPNAHFSSRICQHAFGCGPILLGLGPPVPGILTEWEQPGAYVRSHSHSRASSPEETQERGRRNRINHGSM